MLLPPVCAVAAALVLLRIIDGILLVVRENYCRNNLVKEAVNQLKFAHANVIGFVYNALVIKEKSYQKYCRYSS